MKRIRHSDNICTVGWTSISANMKLEDMAFLRELHPKGQFVACYAAPWGIHRQITPELHGFYLDKELYYPYYFQFPCDEDGLRLLSVLMILGMEIAEGFDNGQTTVGSYRRKVA